MSPNTVGTTIPTLYPTATTTMMSEESTATAKTTLMQETTALVLTTTSTPSSSPLIYEIMPTTLPSITSTPTTGMESIASQTVFRFLQPQENLYILQVSPNQQSINLNCTAFYNGSSDNITIKWTRNDRVIFIDTEQYTEMNIVSTILEINGQPFGSYTCTFHHSMGQSARELRIISSGKMQF